MRAREAVVLIIVSLALGACGTTVQLGDQASVGGPGGTQGLGPGAEPPGAVAGPDVTTPGASTGQGPAVNTPGTATGQGGPTPQGPAAPGQGQLGQGPSGSVVGVTAKTISLGIITADGFSKASAGFGVNVNTGNMRQQSTAVINHLNAHGGIAGRRIVPVYYDVNLARAVSDPASEKQAACAAFTQDNKVYAVATVFAFQDESVYQCLRRAGVITLAAGEAFDRDFFTRFAGSFYMPVEMNMTRVLTNNIVALKSAGFFSGWNPATGNPGPNPVKVGLLRRDSPDDVRVRDQGVKPALASQGLALTDEQAISTTDLGQMTSQYQAAVLRFASAGITHVLYTFTSPLVFMQQADSQRYYPRHALHSRSSPAALLQGNAPAKQLHGSMGIGWQQYNDVDTSRDPGPPSERAKLCLKLLQEAGQNTSVRATALVGLWYCDTLFFLRDALASTRDLTRTGFRRGAEALSRYEAASTFRSVFGPGRLHDGAGSFRLFAFGDACSCFSYTSGLRAAS